MKKIVFVLTAILAFSLSSSAQSKKELTKEEMVKQESLKKESPEVNAKNDALELTKFLGLKENQTNDFYRLFEGKYKALQNNLSDERKAELSRVMEAKIRATLGDDLMSKLEKNETLYKRLVN
ncbi:hypothetical protein [Flavobacterium sp.]